MLESHLTPPVGSRPIERAPGYRICDGGCIYSCRTKSGKLDGSWHVMVPKRDIRNGRLSVGLRINGKRRFFQVHRLVLETFKGPCPPGLEACHNDGNHINNFVYNLRWDTQESNMRDRDKHGTTAKGECFRRSGLKESDIVPIFKLFFSGVTKRKIAKDYGVHESMIGCIIRRVKWKHVPIPVEYLPRAT